MGNDVILKYFLDLGQYIFQCVSKWQGRNILIKSGNLELKRKTSQYQWRQWKSKYLHVKTTYNLSSSKKPTLRLIVSILSRSHQLSILEQACLFHQFIIFAAFIVKLQAVLANPTGWKQDF